MSGPKVIEVVTREAMIDRCRTAISEVDHALSEWQRIIDRNMIEAPAELERLSRARDELRSLLTAERFGDVQRRAPRVVAAVQSSVQQQLLTQAREAAARRRQETSLRFSAEAVLARCREMSLDLPAECVRVLAEATAAQPSEPKAIQQALAQATAALYRISPDGPSEAQQELARALGATGEAASASELLGTAQESLVDPRILRIASQLADISDVSDSDVVNALKGRLEMGTRAESQGDLRHRNLLLDSLEIDLVPVVRQAEATRELQHELGRETAAARATNDWEACRADLDAAETALRRGDHDSGRTHLAQAKSLREERRRHRAAQASRTAILDGLKELGYEVREGMATQWAEKKQLVVRHAAKPGVALELAGTLDGGRLQARMVALEEAARDPHADKAVEDQWCSELDSLRKSATGRGCEIKIVKAVAAGAIPLKVASDDRFEEERQERRLNERHLQGP